MLSLNTESLFLHFLPYRFTAGQNTTLTVKEPFLLVGGYRYGGDCVAFYSDDAEHVCAGGVAGLPYAPGLGRAGQINVVTVYNDFYAGIGGFIVATASTLRPDYVASSYGDE